MSGFYHHFARTIILLGALFALGGGIFLGFGRPLGARSIDIERFAETYPAIMFGLGGFALLMLAGELLALMRAKRLETPRPEEPAEEEEPEEIPEPEPTPPTTPAPKSAPATMETVKAPQPPPPPDARSLYKLVRTYIELEMWELAIEKANLILRHHPKSPEANMVQKIMNDLRWKAEPKFVEQAKKPMSREKELELRKKGITTMLAAVKAYVDLEMWDLAKEKAMLIINHFPDSDEAKELAKIVKTIGERQLAPAPAPATAAPAAEPAPTKPANPPGEGTHEANTQVPPAHPPEGGR